MIRSIRKRIICKKHFGPVIDITDPSYERDAGCRLNDIPVKEGEYTCSIFEVREGSPLDSSEKQETDVAGIGISLTGRLPEVNLKNFLGEICVDAGLAGFFCNKPDTTSEEWGEFASRIDYDEDVSWIFEEGFFSSSGYGDGRYPVFALRDENNEIEALVIDFLVL